ncbi:MAG: hypothetical protein ACR2OR_02495 [Hyphomicrobiales bacterium]
MALQESIVVKRVLVAMRNRSDAEVSANTAAVLAKAFNATVRGIFMADKRVKALPKIPGAIVVGSGGVPVKTTSKTQIKTAQDKEFIVCKRALEGETGGTPLSCEVVHMSAETNREIGAQIKRGDVILLNRSEVMEGLEEFLATSRAIASTGAGLVLISTQLSPEPGPIIVIDDGDETALSAVALGGQIAEETRHSIEVHIVADGKDEQIEIAARAEEILVGANDVRFKYFDTGDKEWILSNLSAAQPDMVLADIAGPLLMEDAFASRIMRAARAPLFVLGNSLRT